MVIVVVVVHLSTYLSIYRSFFLSISLSISHLITYLSINLSISLFLSSNYLSIYQSISLSVCLSIYLSICKLENEAIQFCETSSIFELDTIQNEAILRDFLNFWTWQRQKRSNSARFLHFFSWQLQKGSNSARHPSKMESWVQSWRPRTNAFCDFSHSICLNYCACHEQVMPGHTKCCTCDAKSSQQTWRSDAPKCNPSQEISAPTS